jgi:hypothetical protein
MRTVHTAESLVEIAHLRNVLESEGIGCLIRNDRLGGVVGEIPFVECWPELWVREPGQESRARRLIAETLSPGTARQSWTCPTCGETLDGQFSECWHCAADDEAGTADP